MSGLPNKRLQLQQLLMIPRIPVALVALLVSVGATSAESQSPTIVVKGRVTDSATARPLPTFQILVTNTTIRGLTDSSGNFALRVPRPSSGRLQILVRYLGFKPRTVGVLVGEASEMDLGTIVMRPWMPSVIEDRFVTEPIGVAIMSLTQDGQYARDSLSLRVVSAVGRSMAAHPPIVVVDRTPGFVARQRSGHVVRPGRLVGARALVFMTVRRGSDSSAIVVRSLDVETGDTLFKGTIYADSAQLGVSLERLADALSAIIMTRWQR